MGNVWNAGPIGWWALAIGCLLIPILIHLIQLYRHQPIRWAAMSFLLRSQRRSRRWIRLKQWLLIASRMGLLLLGLILISQAHCDQPGFEDFFRSGQVTHHLVLWDDSYSMEHQSGGSTAHQRAQDALRQLLEQLQGQPQQQFSLVTFSNAENRSMTPEADEVDSIAFVDQQVVTGTLANQVLNELSQQPPSYRSAAPDAAVQWAMERTQQDPSLRHVIHVISDFRQTQWQADSPIWKQWKSDSPSSRNWNLVDCGSSTETQTHPNLSLEELRSTGNLNTTRTGFLIQVAVKNRDLIPAKNVVVSLESWARPQDASRLTSSEQSWLLPERTRDGWEKTDLPAVLIPEIPPGETRQQTFSVSFSQPGLPVLVARLPDDPLPADNLRQIALTARPTHSLLVLDDQLSNGSWLLSQSLNPAGMTGAVCQIDTSAALNRMSLEELQTQKAILCLDVPRLDVAAVEKLKRYVQSGGGLFWMVGPRAQSDFYNEVLFTAGLFPVRLEHPVKTPERLEGEPADLTVKSHPIFDPFLQDDVSQLDAVVFQWIWKVDAPTDGNVANASPSLIGDLSTLATFRAKPAWPLLLEHRLNGNAPSSGRILTFLNSWETSWNNWPQELTFPAMVLLATDHIAQAEVLQEGSLSSTNPIALPETTGYQASLLIDYGEWQAGRTGIAHPIEDGTARRQISLHQTWDSLPDASSGSADNIDKGNIPVGPAPWVVDQTTRSSTGTNNFHRWVTNVDTTESDLTPMDWQLLDSLPAQHFQRMSWNQVQWQAGSQSDFGRYRILAIVLLGVMLLEGWTALKIGSAG